jgi:hypothetical protein
MKSICTVILLSALAIAADQKGGTTVDSGSFVVMVGGKRVAKENFTMQQGANGNSVVSTLEFDNGTAKAQQQADLEVGSNGALHKYTWQELKPGKAKVVTEPQDTFIVVHQKMSETDTGKDITHPLDASTTSIVDENFYSHVQVLIWRYMAMNCDAKMQCKFEEQKLPVFVPHEDMTQVFTLSYAGDQAILVKKSMMKANKFQVKTEVGEMTVWMDGVKMVKLSLPGSNVEVVRE